MFSSSEAQSPTLNVGALTGQRHISSNSCAPCPYLHRKNALCFIMSLPDPFDPPSEDDHGSPLSVSEGPSPAQRKTAKRDRKPRTDQCTAWKVKGEANVEGFAGESTNGMTVEAKANMLKECLRLLLGNEKPSVVLSMTVIVNSADYSGPPGACQIHFTGYVQTKQTSVNPLKAWIGQRNDWTQMNGGLCGNPEFEVDMKKTLPWLILPIFSKVALNNAGRKAKRVIAR
jgi:hypothetical protein